MHSDIPRIVQAFADQRVLVVGDAILDRYLHGTELRFCREAPVPNVTVGRIADRAGGAANTALNLSSLGAEVSFAGVLGADAAGDALQALLQAHGIELQWTQWEHGRATPANGAHPLARWQPTAG